MLNLSRRHSSSKCGKTKKRDCTCPIWATGTLHGKKMRKALGIRNWEAAQKIVRDWEARVEGDSVTMTEAFERYLADCEARQLSSETLRKYELMRREMTALFGSRSVDSVGIEELSKYRESWKLSAVTSRKKVERLRSFFNFCIEREWTDKNPARKLKHAKTVQAPTLPFSDEEMEKVLAGIEKYPNHPLGRRKQLRAFILLLRYSGLRIGDAVGIERDRLAGGAVFLFTAKTGTPVRCPLPQVAQDAINELSNINGNARLPFFSGNGQLKTAVANWQRTIEKLGKIAGVPNFHAHRFRDTAAVSWLQHGISIEDVSILLGHSDIRVTQRHYSPWIKVRQERLEAAVRATF